MENKKLVPGQVVKFTAETLAFNTVDNTEFKIEKGAKALVVKDEDAGPIGACKVQIEAKDGKKIIVEVNDKHLEVVG